MKKIIILALPFLLISCKNETTKLISQKTDFSDSIKLIPAKKENLSSPDTIFFSYDEKKKRDEFALATLLNKKYTKDSVCTADFRLDFIKKDKTIYSHNVRINGFDKGSDWWGNLELDSISSPIKKITVGYAACGYTQDNFLFFINNTKSDLLHQWQSMSDSGWGTWTEIIPSDPKNFYCRTVSFSPEDDSEDIGIEEYSDSIHFEFKNNKWSRTLLTSKEKVYRRKKTPFEEFYSAKE